jgi:hypothetical protein
MAKGMYIMSLSSNRVLALCYRAASFALCLCGILDITGVFKGAAISWEMLLYYTTESNILVLIMFGVLALKTAADIKKNGVAGSASYFERASSIVMLAITVTFIVFWVMLAPRIQMSFLLTFSNLQLHAITPLLMIFDYFLFAAPGKMTKRDPWIFALIPIAYFIQSTVLGYSGVRYGNSPDSPRFPYFFIDFDAQGWRVFIYMLVMSVFFIALSRLLLWYDRKRASSVKT